MSLVYDPRSQEWVEKNPEAPLNVIAKRATTLTSRKPAQYKKSQTQIENDINNHDIYGWVNRLHCHVMQNMGWQVLNITWRNNRGACVIWSGKNKFHQFKYGYQCVQTLESKGFREYVKAQPVWSKNGYKPTEAKGKLCLWQFVLHELAHYYNHAIKNNPHVYRDHHPQAWRDCLNELIILFPFEEINNEIN